MQNFDYYRGLGLDRPKCQPKPSTHGKHISLMNSSELEKYTIALREYEAAKEIYDVELREYNAAMQARAAEFKTDLFAEFNVTKNDKAEKCYSLAYQWGHASGFSEVHSIFSELVELIS